MVSRRFIEVWEPRYDTGKFPVDFFREHSKGALKAERPEQLKERLIALLHWKDGKAGAYVLGERHAKPNILDPIDTLTRESLAKFFESWKLAQTDEKDVMRCTNNLGDILRSMWKTVVIPAFILHVVRPELLPIIDQHTVRAFLALTEGKVIEEPSITWHLWGKYKEFFQDVVLQAGYNHNREERCKVDRALFAWGKSLKDSVKSNQEPKLDKRRKSTDTERAPERENSYSSGQQTTNAIEEIISHSHQGNVILHHNFDDVYINLEKRGEIEVRTASGKNFKVRATITRRGDHKGQATIRFLNEGRENARAYRCCWGHYYNCNGARIGMYCKALDAVLS